MSVGTMERNAISHFYESHHLQREDDPFIGWSLDDLDRNPRASENPLFSGRKKEIRFDDILLRADKKELMQDIERTLFSVSALVKDLYTSYSCFVRRHAPADRLTLANFREWALAQHGITPQQRSFLRQPFPLSIVIWECMHRRQMKVTGSMFLQDPLEARRANVWGMFEVLPGQPHQLRHGTVQYFFARWV